MQLRLVGSADLGTCWNQRSALVLWVDLPKCQLLICHTYTAILLTTINHDFLLGQRSIRCHVGFVPKSYQLHFPPFLNWNCVFCSVVAWQQSQNRRRSFSASTHRRPRFGRLRTTFRLRSPDDEFYTSQRFDHLSHSVTITIFAQRYTSLIVIKSTVLELLINRVQWAFEYSSSHLATSWYSYSVQYYNSLPVRLLSVLFVPFRTQASISITCSSSSPTALQSLLAFCQQTQLSTMIRL